MAPGNSTSEGLALSTVQDERTELSLLLLGTNSCFNIKFKFLKINLS